MAKKDSSKNVKDKKEPVQYHLFIQGPLRQMITSYKDEIYRMCSEYRGIEEMPLDCWKSIDRMILEILKKAADEKWNTNYMRMSFAKRISPYSLACKVREMQTKENILFWIDSMDITGDDVDWNAHCCYQVFIQLAVMIGENSRQEKISEKKD